MNLLVAAIYYGDLELTQCVVENFKKARVDFNSKMYDDSSALDLAYAWRRFDIADFLEQEGVKCLVNGGKGPTTEVNIRAMHLAQNPAFTHAKSQ